MATETMSPVAANHNYKLSYLLCAAESAANLQRDLSLKLMPSRTPEASTASRDAEPDPASYITLWPLVHPEPVAKPGTYNVQITIAI
jgi:hypothetical protein